MKFDWIQRYFFERRFGTRGETLRAYCERMGLPYLLAQFAAENAPLTASDVAANSSKRVWWRCGQGHRFRMSVAARSEKKQGCPVCSGRIKPREAAEKEGQPVPMAGRVPMPGDRPAI